MPLKRGAYVTLDGPDGVGKSWQAAQLSADTDSYLTREPGGHIQEIRAIVQSRHVDRTPEAEVLLFSADRNITMNRIVRPLLAKGKSVVSDRSNLSTQAYQCYGYGVDPEYVRRATDLAVGDTRADLALILDAPYEVVLARSQGRQTQDRFEAEDRDFKTRVRNGYLEIAKEMGKKAVIIDASGSKEDTYAQIYDACGELLIEGIVSKKANIEPH